MSTQTTTSSNRTAVAHYGSLTRTHWIALSLAAVTGLLHVYLYVTESWLPFLLAGVGFLGAIGLFFTLESYRRAIYVAGVLFTLAQIVGYLLIPFGSVWLAVVDKTIQVALIVALGYLFVTERPTPAAADGERS